MATPCLTMSLYHPGHPLPQAQVLSVSRKKRILNHALGLACLGLKFRYRVRAPAPTPGLPLRVLILEPFGMGDIIALEPLVSNLLAAGTHVTLAGQSRWADLIPASDHFQWLPLTLPWASYSGAEKYQLARLRTALSIATTALEPAARAAIAIDPRGDLRSVALLWRAGASRVLTLSDYSHSNAGNSPWAAETWKWDRRWNKWRSNLASMELLGMEPAEIRPPRFARSASIHKPATRSLGLIPIAPWAGKLWPPARWHGLADHLRKEDWNLVGLGGPGQTQDVRLHLGSAVPIVECASIGEWRHQLEQLDHVVTVDSGPMHLAAALGIPSTALFGGGLLPVWAPSGEQSRVVTHQFGPGKGPCHQIGENLEYEKTLMELIRVEEVSAAIDLTSPSR
jgi:ADP-heptose:LPS heptosyltransferase